jgi:glycosyltransferase involved in cell wall biosynthesis
MVITEALILGVPCVAGRYPALPEIIRNNENGIITENSVAGIEKAIEELIRNSEKLSVLKHNAVESHYSYYETYSQFMELCE